MAKSKSSCKNCEKQEIFCWFSGLFGLAAILIVVGLYVSRSVVESAVESEYFPPSNTYMLNGTKLTSIACETKVSNKYVYYPDYNWTFVTYQNVTLWDQGKKTFIWELQSKTGQTVLVISSRNCTSIQE